MIHFEHVRQVSKRNYVPTNYKISNGNIMAENRQVRGADVLGAVHKFYLGINYDGFPNINQSFMTGLLVDF